MNLRRRLGVLWTAPVSALLVLAIFSPPASACPITRTLGAGAYTLPFTRSSAVLKSTGNILTTVSNLAGINSCSGQHDLELPNPTKTPNEYILFATAGMGGFSALFFGSSATGTLQHTYSYSVGCGPCPAGTPIDLEVQGSSEWLQFGAAVGVLKLAGTASSTLTGSLQVDPFPGSPFALGPTPATASVSAGLGTATIGSEIPQTTPFSSVASAVCPLSPQTVRIDLSVSASRTGGATTGIASFNSVEMQLTSDCSCPTDVIPVTVEVTLEESTADPPVSPTTPSFLSCLVPSPDTAVSQPNALLALENGDLLFTETTTSADAATLLAQGPQTAFMTYDGTAVSSANFYSGPLGLVSSVVRGTHVGGGPFSTGNLVAVEGAAWDWVTPALDAQTERLLLIDEYGAVTDLVLSESIVLPSALVFAKGGYFGDDLIVALSDTGKLATVSPAGTVNTGALSYDFGTPVSLAWGPEGSSFAGKLLVADVGSREANGALTSGTGRILAVDGTTGSVSTFASGLDAPVALGFFGGDPDGCLPTNRLYVLEAGTADPISGKLDPGSGALGAYTSSAVVEWIAEDLDSPTDFDFRSGSKLVLASASGFLEASSSGSSSGLPALLPPGLLVLLAGLAGFGVYRLSRRRS